MENLEIFPRSFLPILSQAWVWSARYWVVLWRSKQMGWGIACPWKTGLLCSAARGEGSKLAARYTDSKTDWEGKRSWRESIVELTLLHYPFVINSGLKCNLLFLSLKYSWFYKSDTVPEPVLPKQWFLVRQSLSMCERSPHSRDDAMISGTLETETKFSTAC